MKAYLLFTCILFAFAGSAVAQEQAPAPIKETLFGKDYKTQMQQGQGSRKRIATDSRKTATSTRSIMFTDYHTPTTSKAAARKANAVAGKPLPSAVSAKDAAANAPKPANIKPPVLLQDASSTPEAKAAPVVKKN